MVIQAAAARDLPEVRGVLEQQHLPLDGVDERVETTLVARDGADAPVVGTAALELYSDGALLRAVAVDAAFQGHRLGHALIAAALEMAQARGAETVFLLTNPRPTSSRDSASNGLHALTCQHRYRDQSSFARRVVRRR